MRCSSLRMRAESVSTVSSSSTGTAACTTIGPGIQVFVHEMHRAAADLHAVLQRLVLRVEPRKGRQQRRMDVQNALRKLAHEMRAEQAHEAGQAHQVDVVLAQFRDQQAIVDFAIEALGRNGDGVQAALAGDLQAARFRAIGNHHRDLGVDRPGGDVVGDGFEIRSAAGEQNARAASSILHARAAALAADHLADLEPRLAQLAQDLPRPCARLRAGTARIMPMPRLNVRR